MTIPHLDLQFEYLQAIKAGKRMEWRYKGLNDWSDWKAEEKGSDSPWYERFDYEIREVPRQQYIPECDVPMALEVEPEANALVWSIAIGSVSQVVGHYYQPHYDPHKMMFMNGFLWATEADARAAWEAMTARRER